MGQLSSGDRYESWWLSLLRNSFNAQYLQVQSKEVKLEQVKKLITFAVKILQAQASESGLERHKTSLEIVLTAFMNTCEDKQMLSFCETRTGETPGRLQSLIQQPYTKESWVENLDWLNSFKKVDERQSDRYVSLGGVKLKESDLDKSSSDYYEMASANSRLKVGAFVALTVLTAGVSLKLNSKQ